MMMMMINKSLSAAASNRKTNKCGNTNKKSIAFRDREIDFRDMFLAAPFRSTEAVISVFAKIKMSQLSQFYSLICRWCIDICRIREYRYSLRAGNNSTIANRVRRIYCTLYRCALCVRTIQVCPVNCTTAAMESSTTTLCRSTCQSKPTSPRSTSTG